MSALHVGLVAIGGKQWMGGANYVRNLATAIRAAAPETALTWLCGEALGDDWKRATPRIGIASPGRLDRWLGRGDASFRRALERSGVSFLYPLTYDNSYNLGLRFPIRGTLAAVRWAGWLPDFQHRYLPELFSAEEIRWRDEQMALLAEEAPRVVLSSTSALDDFRAFFPGHAAKGIRLSFRVAPIDPAEEDPPLDDLPERFLLVCNQFWKHKNHQAVFAALALLRARGVRPTVLCTGSLSDYRGDEYLAGLRAQLDDGGLHEQVRFLGLVPSATLRALLRRCVAVVQPSLFEGWSTVVEDVRNLGRPCLLSDLPVHREQNPAGALFFDPRVPEELAFAMEKAWRDWPHGRALASEAAAFAQAKALQQQFGAEFLALARSAAGAASFSRASTTPRPR